MKLNRATLLVGLGDDGALCEVAERSRDLNASAACPSQSGGEHGERR
jgi:hypothetical protein